MILDHEVDDGFFNNFKKELEKLFKINLAIRVTEMQNSTACLIEAYNRVKYFSFEITRFYANCGAAIIANIDIPNRNIKTFNKSIVIIDNQIRKCMVLLERYGAYYTLAIGDQRDLYEALIKCGWKVIGKGFTNENTGNKIITLRKVYRS